MATSVIIPTYNRPQTLLQALRSLQNQKLPSFEIIVVDNADDSKVRCLVGEFNQTARVPVRYVPEPRVGLHNARHAGARAAAGEILVFTDDDATFDRCWLQAYAEAFELNSEMAASGGPVRPVWETPPPQWLLNYVGDAKWFPILSLWEPYQGFRLDSKGLFFGVNMAIRRDVLFEVGGFNPESFGATWLGDGETGLNRKLWQRKMPVGYVPNAVVYHHIPPERMTIEYLRRRMANEGACEVYARFHHGVPHWIRLFKHAATIAISSSKSWLAAFLLRGRTDARSLDIQIQAAYTQSQLTYVIRLMLNRDLQKLVVKKDWLNESPSWAAFSI